MDGAEWQLVHAFGLVKLRLDSLPEMRKCCVLIVMGRECVFYEAKSVYVKLAMPFWDMNAFCQWSCLTYLAKSNSKLPWSHRHLTDHCYL